MVTSRSHDFCFTREYQFGCRPAFLLDVSIVYRHNAAFLAVIADSEPAPALEGLSTCHMKQGEQVRSKRYAEKGEKGTENGRVDNSAGIGAMRPSTRTNADFEQKDNTMRRDRAASPPLPNPQNSRG